MAPSPNGSPSSGFQREFASHRPALLSHCYRMLGSYGDAEDVLQDILLKGWRARETFRGDVPLAHWLMRIATNSCLKALSQRKARVLPQLESGPSRVGDPLQELEAARWVTPAPDAQLFARPDQAAEARESVALAFIALLQRLPPKQRAALLLKDVLGWSVEEISESLSLSVSAVSSALHRARETVATRPQGHHEEPPPEVLQGYIRSWESHDLDSLVAQLKRDVVLAMPPHATWYQGTDELRRFFQAARFEAFWSKGLKAFPTRANGLAALVWYSPAPDGAYRPHSVHVMRFDGGLLAEAVNFIGKEYLRGFEIPETLPA